MIRRTFISWDEPALPRAADLLAERYASDGELDLGRALVVFPGRRPGRRLSELLVDRAEDRDAVLTPPRVTTVGELPELLYRPDRPLADGILSRRIWARVLAHMNPEERSAVFPDPPAADDAAAWHGLGRLVDELHRDLGAEDLDFAAVARHCRDRDAFDDSRRWKALAGAQQAYHRELEKHGRRDRAPARREALESGSLTVDEDVWLVGVVEMPGMTAAMLGSLHADVRAIVHAPEERGDDFDELGLVRTAAWLDAEIEIPDDAMRVCGRPPEQADEAVRFLRGEPAGDVAPDEITIGVPDHALVPYLAQRLEAFGVPHRDAAGMPLDRTPPYRLLAAVADYLDGRRFEDLAVLLRHPDVEPLTDDPAPLETADRYYREHLPDRAPGAGSRRSAEARRFAELMDALEGALGLGRFSGRRTVGGWMPLILELLVEVYGDEPLDRSQPVQRRLVEACRRLGDAATSLHRLPTGADERSDGATAIRLLLAETRGEAVPPAPDEGAIEMLGWLELHLDDAPELLITGFDDESVPGAVAADLFLPNALRRSLGLPDDDDRFARDAYRLQAILRSRPETCILVGRRDAEGNPRRPSRLLLTGSGEALARRVERLFGGDPDRRTAPSRLGVAAARNSSFRTPPEPEILLGEGPETLRVTDFRRVLQAPYRFALERRRGLRELHDRDRELDGAAFGSFAHDVLHRFGDRPEADSDDPGTLREILGRVLDELARERFGDRVQPAVRLQIEQLRFRLRSFADWHARRRRAGWRVVEVEAAPEEGVPFEVDGETVLLSGRIDRIEWHEERGEWALLDYKTGESAADPDAAHRSGRGDERRWVDLQLPLYRHLLPGVAWSRPPPAEPRPDDAIRLGYVNLPRGEAARTASAEWTQDELAKADEAARDVVRYLRSGRIVHDSSEARTWRNDPLADLLGIGRLESAGSTDPVGEGKDVGG